MTPMMKMIIVVLFAGVLAATGHYWWAVIVAAVAFLYVGQRWYEYRQNLKWFKQHLREHPEHEEGVPDYVMDAVRRRRPNADRRGDQNELDCLAEMAETYTRSGYPSREYIERCIREAAANIEPSRKRDAYLQIAREALEAGPRSESGLVIKAD
jgi:hypothetical protein